MQVDNLINEGFDFLSSGNLVFAKDRFIAAIDIASDNSNANFGLGCVYLLQKNYEEAISLFQKVIETDPEYINCYTNLGFAYSKIKKTEEAKVNFKKVIQLRPLDAIGYNNMGTVLYDEGNNYEAEKYFRQAIKLHDRYPDAYYNLGKVFNKKGDVTNAENSFRKAISIIPDNPEYYNELGILLKDVDRLEEAEECCKKALELSPNYSAAYNTLGNIFFEKKDYKNAERHFRKTITLDPDNPVAYYSLGALLYEDNNFEEAEKYALKAMQRNSADPKVYNLLGGIYLNTEQEEKAYKYFKTSVNIDHYYSTAFINLSDFSIEINSNRTRDFARGIFLLFKEKSFERLTTLIQKAVDFDMPLVVCRIAFLIPLSQWEGLTLINGTIQEHLQNTRFLRHLIQIWSIEKNRSVNSWSAEAIINYYLGDIATAYNIINDKIDVEENILDFFTLYYFCLSAHEIMEEEETVIANAVQQVDSLLSINMNLTDTEMYYAGLIYYLGSQHEKAIKVLKSIFPRFINAGYKLVEIYKATYTDETNENSDHSSLLRSPQAIQLMQEILHQENIRPVYKFGLRPINPLTDEKNFLESIMPVIHFMEVQSIIGYVFEKPFDISNAFFNLIRISETRNDKKALFLMDEAIKNFRRTIIQDLDNTELNDILKPSSDKVNWLDKISAMIQTGANTDCKQTINHPDSFKLKLYLTVSARLYHNKIITSSEAMCILMYIYLCLDIYSEKISSELKQYVLNFVNEYFLDSTFSLNGFTEKLSIIVRKIKKAMIEINQCQFDFHQFMRLYEEAEI